MKILALDTATEACSVSLGIGDRSIERYVELERGHAEQCCPWSMPCWPKAGIALARARCDRLRPRARRLHGRAAGGQRRAGPGVRRGRRRGAGLRPGGGRAAGRSDSSPALRRVLVVQRCAHARGVLGALRASMAARRAPGRGARERRRGRAAARRSSRRHLGGRRPRASRPGPTSPSAAARPAPRCMPDLLPRASEVLALARPPVAGGPDAPPEAALPVYVRDRRRAEADPLSSNCNRLPL